VSAFRLGLLRRFGESDLAASEAAIDEWEENNA
jgi:hypothetical protein